MAEVKISELTSGSTLDGTEVVPIVQGGVTKKVAVSNLAGQSYGQEALSYSTDLALDRIDNTYNNVSLSLPDFTANYENLKAGLFLSYAYRWSNWAYMSWASQTGSTWSSVTINNENLAFFRFVPASGTGTITINSTRIGNLNNLVNGCTYNLPNCEAIYNNLPAFNQVTPLTFTANALKFIPSLSISSTSTISMTSLETIQGSLTFSGTPSPTFTNNSVQVIGNQISYTGSSMTSITLDNLKIVGSVNLSPATNPNLFTTFSFNSIKEVQGNFTTNTTIGLSQASVDHILVKLAALDGTNGTTVYQNKTVTVRGAAPSATGNAAKATLIARGCTVTTS